MPDPVAVDAPDPEAQAFYEGAYSRIMRAMVALAIVFTAAATMLFGWRVGAGFLIGCGLAAVNFLWMKSAITTFSGRLTQPVAGEEKKARGTATRFAVRYLLISAVAYVIFKSSILSFSGVLAGLFLPVAAILLEAVYETYVALRRGL